ncbi:MAG: sigma-54 dependent transcriptional regulator [Bacteroides sp.]|nr:sigma-54 dependent transcriptional regulator [Roseburia sp.]MCM1346395.1 sigma-54 dependent transcriptional regulator [Bacteroides sp.]MCM1421790.1 sigma-54 dependent transcriptional regulator [Bacteroides sp.]
MILVIDDDKAIRVSLTYILERNGYEVMAVEGPDEAMAVVRSMAPQLVLMDMNFTLSTDGEEGLTLLRQVKLFRPEVPVILMTAWGSINLAVEGMRAGAFDFITKPWNNSVLMQRIETALDITRKDKDNAIAAPAGNVQLTAEKFPEIIGCSVALREVLATVERVARTNASVLITGESGTGKELVAEALHKHSVRAGKPFVKVNLGGISQTLFESEMFGHKKGAFTDAHSDRTGRFEMADGGTIFLDEIGELDRNCQVKLLRVLQDQTFEVLGDSRPRKVNVRVVSATNADLPRMVQERTFREDLFYRINLITLHLPPLRERREDIPLLVRHFIARQCECNSLPPVEVSPDALTFLKTLTYPGNIRELKNLVERTLLISGHDMLTEDDFRRNVAIPAGQDDAALSVLPPSSLAAGMTLTLEEMERQTIVQALDKYGGNISLVAAALGISRGALYRRMEKYGIK